MSSLYSEVLPTFPGPVMALPYPDITLMAVQAKPDMKQADQLEPAPSGPSPAEIEALLQRARAEATADTERRLRKEYDDRLAREAANIREALEVFAKDRTHYFGRVEAEIIRLSLAIAGKILHREAQVDPMLVAALVRLAIEKLEAGSSVTIRLSPAKCAKWRGYFSDSINGCAVVLAEDPDISEDDCILETAMGSANFSIDAQLKEVEQGFFDLLAQRPA